MTTLTQETKKEKEVIGWGERWGRLRFDMRMALIVMQRELVDSARDWRILIPIILLTFGFPVLMNFAVRQIISFSATYGGDIVAERLIPLLLLLVGFFPATFCLVIALETFVGEKERKSLEPLLSTPLTNLQLYVGKMMAAVAPPLVASYVGIGAYVLSLMQRIDWQIDFQLLVLVLLLTTVQAVMMVAAAVVVSSQTTSVRASNLLASFIIIPITFLIQAEAAAMFWGNISGLWWLLLALMITTGIFIRMGVNIFNREELLGRDIDHIRAGWAFGVFWERFTGRGAEGYPSLSQWFRGTFAILSQLRQPAMVLLVGMVLAMVFGAVMADEYQVPAELKATFLEDGLQQNLDELQLVARQLPLTIFLRNVRALAASTLLGIFTFGVLSVFGFVLPWILLSFLAAQLVGTGLNPVVFFAAAVAPHGILELPALLLTAAAALRWHTGIIAPPPHRTVSENWLLAAADFGRVFVALVIPMLFVSAFIEGYVTPLVVIAVYGG
ncbi:MAG TPA: stage II sporulation protein M [Anaerolineae bacterium]|nr:stage II sporulation protein M [Anaerolineae bacterium]